MCELVLAFKAIYRIIEGLYPIVELGSWQGGQDGYLLSIVRLAIQLQG